MKSKMNVAIVLNATTVAEKCGCRLLAELTRQARMAPRGGSWDFSVQLDDKGRAVLLGRSATGALRTPQFIDCGCDTTTREQQEDDPAFEQGFEDNVKRSRMFYGDEFKMWMEMSNGMMTKVPNVVINESKKEDVDDETDI